MLRLDPEAFSTRWYKMMAGDCSAAAITTVCSDKWKIGALNSLIIAVIATVLATAMGTLAALGLEPDPTLVGRRAIMAFPDLADDRAADHHRGRHVPGSMPS